MYILKTTLTTSNRNYSKRFISLLSVLLLTFILTTSYYHNNYNKLRANTSSLLIGIQINFYDELTRYIETGDSEHLKNVLPFGYFNLFDSKSVHSFLLDFEKFLDSDIPNKKETVATIAQNLLAGLQSRYIPLVGNSNNLILDDINNNVFFDNLYEDLKQLLIF